MRFLILSLLLSSASMAFGEKFIATVCGKNSEFVRTFSLADKTPITPALRPLLDILVGGSEVYDNNYPPSPVPTILRKLDDPAGIFVGPATSGCLNIYANTPIKSGQFYMNGKQLCELSSYDKIGDCQPDVGQGIVFPKNLYVLTAKEKIEIVPDSTRVVVSGTDPQNGFSCILHYSGSKLPRSIEFGESFSVIKQGPSVPTYSSEKNNPVVGSSVTLLLESHASGSTYDFDCKMRTDHAETIDELMIRFNGSPSFKASSPM
jgi:hypothetical protein